MNRSVVAEFVSMLFSSIMMLFRWIESSCFCEDKTGVGTPHTIVILYGDRYTKSSMIDCLLVEDDGCSVLI